MISLKSLSRDYTEEKTQEERRIKALSLILTAGLALFFIISQAVGK